MQFVQPIRSVEQLETMKEVLRRGSERDWVLLVMGINVGLRIGDLLRLNVRDVRNKSHLIHRERKTGKMRRFPINAELRAIINEYIKGKKDSDPLFPSYRTKLNIGRQGSSIPYPKSSGSGSGARRDRDAHTAQDVRLSLL